MNDFRDLLELLISQPLERNATFSKLRERLTHLVRQYIWNAGRDRGQMIQDVEDVVQEILLAIHIGIKKNNISAEKLVPWALRIARNKINDYFRQKLNKNFDRLKEDPLNGEMNRPDLNFEKSERLKSIQAAIGKLSEKEQKIIYALINGNIKSYIIEESKRMPVDTVYVHIHRCRKRFEKILQKEGII